MRYLIIGSLLTRHVSSNLGFGWAANCFSFDVNYDNAHDGILRRRRWSLSMNHNSLNGCLSLSLMDEIVFTLFNLTAFFPLTSPTSFSSPSHFG